MITYKVYFGHCEDYYEDREVQESTHNSFEAALIQAMPSGKFRGKASVTNLETNQQKSFKVSSPISWHMAGRISEIIPGTEEYYN